MKSLFGTPKLVSIILKVERFKLLVTIVGLGLLFILLAFGVSQTYSTEEARIAYAATSALSAVAMMFNGPVLGPSLGSVAFTETFTFFSIFVGLMSTFLIIRHTRLPEESGRSELIGSLSIGRHAQLAAALLVAVFSNLLLGVFVSLGFLILKLPLEGALLSGIAMAMIGIVFACIAGITAQLSTTARGANGLAVTSIGLAFLIRAIGDMRSEISENGLVAISSWISWLSPIGIARNARPFADNSWGVLLILLLLSGVLAWVAFKLASQRDYGSGLLQEKTGRATAKRSLLSSFGLAWRLQKGVLIGWAFGLGILAISLGSVAREVGVFLSSNEQATQLIAALGGSQNLVDAYLSICLMICAVAISAYTIQTLLIARSEETSGHLELLLATRVSKGKWLTSQIACSLIGSTLLLILCGFLAGLSYGITIDDAINQAGYMTLATLLYVPAIMIFSGTTALAFALIPSFSIAGSWLAFAVTYLIVQIGPILSLPEQLINISPFTHIPKLPVEDLSWPPLLIITEVALLFLLISIVGFRKRNIQTS